MGGNQKANRTKGNTKPSSSSRSAQLLSDGGLGVQGFIGFESSDQAVVPATGSGFEDENEACGLDGEIRMILRKMSKRDEVTKLKAIQEFEELCKAKSTEELKSALPFWPRIFGKLSQDHNRKIRESVHLANGKLLMKVGRDVAPHLRALMEWWFVGSCDPYSPASTAAFQSLRSVFPGTKLSNVLMHCKLQIFKTIENNLLNETVQTLSDPKIFSAEEMETKYGNVVCSSMLSVGLFFAKTPTENHPQFQPLLSDVISNAKFWKFSKHKDLRIKSAFFKMISSICKYVPKMASGDQAKSFCTTVLNNLDNCEPAVSPNVWESALYVVLTIQNFAEFVSVENTIVSKILFVVRNSGHGNATLNYPNILPLIAKFPDKVFESEKKFQVQLLDAFYETMKQKDGKLQKSELNATIEAQFECFKFFINKMADDSDNRRLLTENYLYRPVREAIFDQSCCLASGRLFTTMGRILFVNNIDKTFVVKFFEDFDENIARKLDFVNVNQNVLNNFLRFFEQTIGYGVSSAANRRTRFEIDDPSPIDCREADPHFFSLLVDRLASFIKDLLQASNDRPPLTAAPLVQILSKAVKLTHVSGITYKIKECEVSFNTKWLLEWSKFKFMSNDNPTADFIFYGLPLFADDKIIALDSILLIECIAQFEKVYEATSRMDDPEVERWLKSKKLCENLFERLKGVMISTDEAPPASDFHSLSSILTLFFNSNFEGDDSYKQSFTRNFQLTIIECLNKLLLKAENDVLDLQKLTNSLELCKMLLDASIEYDGQMFVTLIKVAVKLNRPSTEYDAIEAICRNMMESSHLSPPLSRLMAESFQMIEVELKRVTSLNKFKIITNNFFDIFFILVDNYLKNGEKFDEDVFLALIDVPLPAGNKCNQSCLCALNECNGGLPNRPSYGSSADLTVRFARSAECMVHALFAVELLRRLLDESFALEESNLHRPKLVGKIYDILQIVEENASPSFVSFRNENEFEISMRLEESSFVVLQRLPSPVLSALFDKTYQLSMQNGHLSSLVLKKLSGAMSQKGNFFASNFRSLISYPSFYWSFEAAQTYESFLPHVSRPEDLHEVASTALAVLVSFEKIYQTNGDEAHCATVPLAILRRTLKFYQEVDESFVQIGNSFFQFLMNKKNNGDEIFTNDSFNNFNTEQFQIISEILGLLRLFMERAPKELLSKHWDLLLCCQGDWIKAMQKTIVERKISDVVPGTKTLLCSLCRLLESICKTVEKAISYPLKNKSDLAMEWGEFFAESMFAPLLHIFVKLSEGCCEEKLSTVDSLTMGEICLALRWIPSVALEKNSLPLKLTVDMEKEYSSIADDVQSLLNHLCPLLLSNVRAVQLGAYYVLCKAIGPLSKYDCNNESDVRSLPPPLVNILGITNKAINSALDGIDVEENFEVDCRSEFAVCAIAHLFSWNLSLVFFGAAPSEMRSKYANYFNESSLFKDMLLHLFKLMPISRSKTKSFFSESVLHDPKVNVQREEIEHLACCIYRKTLQKVPALVRQWWNRQDKRTALFVERFTAQNVSSLLCVEEIDAVRSNENFGNMTIKPRPSAREVVSTYTVDEVSMELIVQLPSNHPLGPINVESGRRVGVGTAQWRNWMLQLTTFLMHQNGSILEGLSLWKKNVDKRFEGVDECMICFYVLHGSTYQLPKLTCRTCKKKYHSACLYKWFNTSNKSSCPLCRNLF